MDFYSKYPNILEICIKTNVILNTEYGFCIDTHEISFDQTIPFLFPIIDSRKQLQLALELRIYREIVNNFNNGIYYPISEEIQRKISIPIITYEQYSLINKNCRIQKSSNLLNSYLLSTKRVFYRFLLVHHYRDIFKTSFYDIYNLIKLFSAFLLFDDDIIDLEVDFTNNKKTLLTEYLETNEYNIHSAIDLIVPMLNLMPVGDNNILEDYIQQFILIYHE